MGENVLILALKYGKKLVPGESWVVSGPLTWT